MSPVPAEMPIFHATAHTALAWKMGAIVDRPEEFASGYRVILGGATVAIVRWDHLRPT